MRLSGLMSKRALIGSRPPRRSSAQGRVALLCLLIAAGAAAAAPPAIPIDDSYTVSQRFYAYRQEHPELVLPVVEFKTGQRVLFDRLYKKVGDRELHMDVFLPAPRMRNGRGIVLVHGGGWRSGNKSNFYAMANLLAQRGYAVFTPEFRLSPEAQYPAGLVDVSDAIAWVKSQASGFHVDRNRIALGGESSGGQMAALLAYSAARGTFKSRPEDDTQVSALIDLDGVLDFLSPLALQYENAAGAQSVAALWLGGAVEQARDRWQEASAVQYLGENSPPTLVIGSGQPRFTAGIDQVRDTLRRHGIRCEFFAFETTPHAFWLFEPYLSQVVDRMDEFLRKTGRRR